ncbi:MAG: aconitate hydratase AcnA [Pseudomonadota bacterium]|nr:aconitate hydratase AcnA [Pseudomonadota bacterium]
MDLSGDSFGARATLPVGDRAYGLYRLDVLAPLADLSRLPYAIRVLLENLLRHEDGASVTREDIVSLARWSPTRVPDREVAFRPARVLLQDFTGVPTIVDLAAMRDALAELGGDPSAVDPRVPVELVIDHSVQVDEYATRDALRINVDHDYARNAERYRFLRWGQRAFKNVTVYPPNAGICHQVNLERLARVVFSSDELRPDDVLAYPDTLVGTDSHTPMVNGLGVLGWGVGGIEAEAAMLGQPISLLVPQVVGVRLDGRLREGATATDLVLTVTERLRKHGVVGKFVEFFGPGISRLTIADRATISNMSPEYGATCAMWPIDTRTLDYLRFTGRPASRVALVEAYARTQGLFHDFAAPEPTYTEVLSLDLADIVPSIAGPRRPQDRVPLGLAPKSFRDALPTLLPAGGDVTGGGQPVGGSEIQHGSVVIAAITSCTNTSNPSVMVAAGLLAQKAVAKGLASQPWVKTSLAPGSRVVTAYYERAGLLPALETLGFHVVGYGCTTCIGNSGPLPHAVSTAVAEGKLVVASVLSGNRNFEGRIQPEVRANYLMSPPLVVAFALAGRIDIDLETEPIGVGTDGAPVYLADIWPTEAEVAKVVEGSIAAEMYAAAYADILTGDARWQALPVPSGLRYAWEPGSSYVRSPPYFEGMAREAPETTTDIQGARCLALLGDSVTTDHISPAGNIAVSSAAGQYLLGLGVPAAEFNSYGARRGNHEVMVRGTFANVRIRNALVPGVEGGYTRFLPTGEVLPIYEAAVRYQAEGTPLVVLAGKEYGSGSSRDWAAKGPVLQGVRAVLAEGYERIHRSNLVGMGIAPLQFRAGESAASHGLTGEEMYDVIGLADGVRRGLPAGSEVTVRVTSPGGTRTIQALVRIDTPREVAYFRHGGILPFAVRHLLTGMDEPIRGGLSGAPQTRPGQESLGSVDEASKESFPGSDPPAYGSGKKTEPV